MGLHQKQIRNCNRTLLFSKTPTIARLAVAEVDWMTSKLGLISKRQQQDRMSSSDKAATFATELGEKDGGAKEEQLASPKVDDLASKPEDGELEEGEIGDGLEEGELPDDVRSRFCFLSAPQVSVWHRCNLHPILLLSLLSLLGCKICALRGGAAWEKSRPSQGLSTKTHDGHFSNRAQKGVRNRTAPS
jgi:hypothetical protein